MTIEHKIYNLPSYMPIQKQLFHVPGRTIDGGFTSGGARISAFEPGGFSMLEIQPALQTGERAIPLSSWLMSKTNGQIIRVRLATTPQCAVNILRSGPGVTWEGGIRWENQATWAANDYVVTFRANANAGLDSVRIGLSDYGPLLQPGHVIGHQGTTYLIEEIEYNVSNVGTAKISPPLRHRCEVNDSCYLRPFFTGQIVNPDQVRVTYDAANGGHIQPGLFKLSEVILP